MNLLTVAELASLLKMSTGQIYEMTRERTRTGAMRDSPLPYIKVNGNLRYVMEDIEKWLESLKKG